MHVLIVPTSHFLTVRYPNGGIFQFHQANCLHRAGYQVGVLSAGVITPRYFLREYRYPRFVEDNGYPVFRHYVRTLWPHRWTGPGAAADIHQRIGTELYDRYVKQFGRPDVIHAHNIEYGGMTARAIHQVDGVPYVVTEHSSRYLTGRYAPLRSELMRDCAREAGVMSAVSQALARAITRKIGVNEIDVMPNLVDAFLLNCPLVDLAGRGSGLTFLNIGSLDDNKNQAGLIEAFAIRFSGLRATLRIGGTGPREPTLRRLAARLGVAGQVVFLGQLDRVSVLREMQLADCFVLSSFHETFGVVVIEALACGRPVITTRCGGPNDVVTAATGLVVEPGDVPALADAMEAMAETRHQYRPEALREDCRTRFGDAAFLVRAGRAYQTARGSS